MFSPEILFKFALCINEKTRSKSERFTIGSIITNKERGKQMEYYIKTNNEKRGPYSIKELMERGINEHSFVMPANGFEWVQADKIEDLRQAIANLSSGKQGVWEEQATGNAAEEIPIVQANPVSENEEKPTSPAQKKRGGCLFYSFLTLLVCVGVLIFTCPKPQDHKNELSDVITATINESVSEAGEKSGSDLLSSALNALSNSFTKQIVNFAADNLITVDNYFVCSVGKVNLDGRDRIVSVGLLGHIFTTDKENLKKAATKYYEKAEIRLEEEIKRKTNELINDKILNPLTDLAEDFVASTIENLFK